MNVVTRQDE